MHLGKAYLASRNHVINLGFGLAQLLCKLLYQWNTAPHELPHILSKEPPLYHGSAIKHSEIIKGYAQTTGNVTQPYKGIIYRVGTLAVCEQLLCTIGYALEVKGCGGRCVYQLPHEALRFLGTPQHGAKSNFKLLELATH